MCICVLSHGQLFGHARVLPGSSVHGISQVRTLEWVAISLQNLNYQLGIKPTPLAVESFKS